MSALKLESFAHDVEIRKGISKFESFDALRETAYAEGVKSGAEAASRAFEDEKSRTLSPILEALNDMAFSQIEARHATMMSMRPMLEELVATILPHAARLGFGPEVAALVSRAYEKSPASKIVVSVAPDAVAGVLALLSPNQADVTVEPDPTLGDLQAKVNWHCGYDLIDIDAAIAGAQAAINTFFTTIENTGTENA